MWTALLDGAANVLAFDGARHGRTMCEVAFVDTFDCAEPDLAGDHALALTSTTADQTFEAPEKSVRTSSHLEPRVTYTLAFLSDYRRGGTTRTDGKPALQGAVDVRLPERWNFGARGSNVAKHGGIELNFYGAKSFDIGETQLSIGATAITYPRDPDADYILLQTSLSRALGPIDATFSVLYAPKQDNLSGEDNFYTVARARTPIGAVLGIPVTLGASIGRMRGHFADARSRSDWSVSLTGRIGNSDVGLSYIDNDLGDSRGDPTAVFSITTSF